MLMYSIRPAEALRIQAVNTALALVDESGVPVWEDADEARMIRRLFEFKVAREALMALEHTTGRLALRQGDQPQWRAHERQLIERNHLIVARSMPTPNEVRALLSRERQLNLWGRAA